MDLARLEHGAHPMQRPVELTVRDTEHDGCPGIGVHEAEDRSQRRGLAGAVRSQEARDRAGLDPEAQAGNGLRLPEPLAEVLNLDHASRETTTVRSRGPSSSQKKMPCQVPSA